MTDEKKTLEERLADTAGLMSVHDDRPIAAVLDITKAVLEALKRDTDLEDAENTPLSASLYLVLNELPKNIEEVRKIDAQRKRLQELDKETA